MTILVTGGAGFIGSNFILHHLQKAPEVNIINLDNLTYAGNLENLKEIDSLSNYRFVKGDIRDLAVVSKLFSEYKIDNIIHFAAETHVDNSIETPFNFINTNIIGTFNLLEVSYRKWMNGPFETKPDYINSRFHHISTDEVYGTLGNEGLFTEKTPYAPNSPYSASKASSDFLVRSYFHTYGLNVVTTNCSNNYGPKQHDEKLIPTIIRKALLEENIPIYGDGLNIRDWLYVKDHCKGIDNVFYNGKSGETYNIGGKNEHTNLYIAQTICDILDRKFPRKGSKSYKGLITFVTDRPGHDFRYAIDASKIEEELNWKAEENLESGILKTIDWYVNKYN